jgi:hypothetical protein
VSSLRAFEKRHTKRGEYHDDSDIDEQAPQKVVPEDHEVDVTMTATIGTT